jgi:hypothetical protein
MTHTTADHERAPLPLNALGWALSIVLAVFMAWGRITQAPAAADAGAWLASGGAGALLLAALGLLMQGVAALGTQAMQRTKTLAPEQKGFAIGMVAIGGAFTAWSFHNAIVQTGMAGDEFGDIIAAWALSVGVPVVEFATWRMDEALRSGAAARQAEDMAKALEDARGREKARQSPLGFDVDAIEERAMSDDALDAAASLSYSLGKRFTDEKRRRAQAALNGPVALVKK